MVEKFPKKEYPEKNKRNPHRRDVLAGMLATGAAMIVGPDSGEARQLDSDAEKAALEQAERSAEAEKIFNEVATEIVNNNENIHDITFTGYELRERGEGYREDHFKATITFHHDKDPEKKLETVIIEISTSPLLGRNINREELKEKILLQFLMEGAY